MYLIREVFKAKPGKAKDLVKMFKQAIPYWEKDGEIKNPKIMTDIVSDYWTVVLEAEVSDLGAFFGGMRSSSGAPEMKEIMKGYIDLLEGGHREVFLIE